jgi:hypothetical protein
MGQGTRRAIARPRKLSRSWQCERHSKVEATRTCQGRTRGIRAVKQCSGYVRKKRPRNHLDFSTGFGKLRGRKIVFTADDFSIRAGHADGALMDKTVRADANMH